MISPAVGSISRRMHRPTVVLPRPDSPTRPYVSPSLISRSTPSTALTYPLTLPRIPPVIGNHFLRPLISRTVLVMLFLLRTGGRLLYDLFRRGGVQVSQACISRTQKGISGENIKLSAVKLGPGPTRV